MKVYLDTNVVSAVAKGDTPPEAEALKKILELWMDHRSDLFTSELTRQEVGRLEGKNRRKIEAVCDILEEVPFIEDHKVLGFHSMWDQSGGVAYPFVEDDVASTKLRQLGLEREDAHHLLVAIRSECEIFLTCDRGILNLKQKVQGLFPYIKVLKPSEFVADMS